VTNDSRVACARNSHILSPARLTNRAALTSQDFDTPPNIRLISMTASGRGLSSFSVKHVLVANWSYELPFESSTGLTGLLVRGWQLNSIVHSASRALHLKCARHNQSET